MNMLARLVDLLRKDYGQGRETRERQKKADHQLQFKLSKKKRFKGKNSSSWAEDWELPREGCYYHGNEVMGYKNWSFWEVF